MDNIPCHGGRDSQRSGQDLWAGESGHEWMRDRFSAPCWERRLESQHVYQSDPKGVFVGATFSRTCLKSRFSMVSKLKSPNICRIITVTEPGPSSPSRNLPARPGHSMEYVFLHSTLVSAHSSIYVLAAR